MLPTTSERDEFLGHLRQSGLLTAQQLREAVGQLDHAPSPTELARALVRCRMLTRFQARMLLHGRTDGFFLGPYRILEQLGHGGMGKVYKALHETMNRTVALKVLSPSLVKTEKARAMFRHEVQTAAQLNHPNIVHAYDSNAIAGRHFLAMEYVKGATLSQLVEQRGSLPIGLACEIIRQAALGLQHAHEKGLVHRDIKPANIMVAVAKRPQHDVQPAYATVAPDPASDPLAAEESRAGDLQVKILDFGLARLARRKKSRNPDDADAGRHPITGTPDWMSPEQAMNRDAVDIRSDLYSLGCTFYYLLTGRLPFPGGGMLDKLIRHQSEVAPAPEVLRPQIPPAVAAIVLKLIAKDAADRFQTPLELAGALAPHASAPSLERARKLHRRRVALQELTPVPDGKTLSDGREDTAPSISLPPAIDAEQEAVATWVATQVEQRRRSRRTWLWTAAALATLAATVGMAALAVYLQQP